MVDKIAKEKSGSSHHISPRGGAGSTTSVVPPA